MKVDRLFVPFWRGSAVATMTALVVACGGGSEPQPSRQLVRGYEEPSCEPSTLTLAQMMAPLARVGVEVRSYSCEWNHITLTSCSVPRTLFHVVEVPADQVQLAATVGYQPNDALPPRDAKVECPK